MKIIGFFGGSGTGKTTVSKRLNEILKDSLLINIDIFMHDECNKQEKEILKTLNIKKDKDIFSYNYYLQLLEINKAVIEIISKNICNRVKEMIKTERSTKQYIILDWYALPLCNLADICDFTICVKSEYNTKLDRLTNRLKDKNIYNEGDRSLYSYQDGVIEKRVIITALDEWGYNAQYYIENNGTLELLYNKIDHLIKEFLV